MRMSAPLVALISSLGITAIALAADDQLMKQAQGLFQPIPLEPPAVKGVTSTPAMVELGTDLYFDPRPRAAAAQYRADGALFPLRPSVGPPSGGRHHGHRPAWQVA
jgi:hypothetical protein